MPVVLCARADPPVALGRLRMDGRLGEIRNADLEFSLDETAALFDAYGIELRRDDVQALWQRTQGWIAGLRLAAGALDEADDRHEVVLSATATEAAVAEYLLEEVLDRQDLGTQEFLLRTSVVDRLTPGLAAVLADDADAQERLDSLERSGVFLTDVSQGGWYRYHALFADLLRAGLRHRNPGLVPELHHRAAYWMLDHGGRSEAEAHARLAGDWAMVGRLAIDRWLAAALDDAEPAPDPLVGTPPVAVADVADLALVAAGQACARGRATTPTCTGPGSTSCSDRCGTRPRGRRHAGRGAGSSISTTGGPSAPTPGPGRRAGSWRPPTRAARTPTATLPPSAAWPGCGVPSCTSTTAASTPPWRRSRPSPTCATTTG